MMKRVILASLIAATPQLALAERPPSYWGVSLGTFEFTNAEDNAVDVTNVGLQGGVQFIPWLGAELRVGAQSSDADGVFEATDTNYAGAFVRFDIPYERINLYLLAGGGGIGYTDAQGDDASQVGPAGGVGIELYGTQRSALKLELMNYSGEDVVYQGINLGFVHHFNWVAPGR